ncbi:MAG: HPr family phosphocarrier protein [Geminicoccaceae bacterium]|nr:MAG: HPr family phosphocarrier protein [Geminicoccaceae bacterium]
MRHTRSAEVMICNRRGLHARAAALFAKTAQEFNAEVTVIKADFAVDGASIMDLMMLAAGAGTALRIEAVGVDAEAALAALVALVEAGFHERG